MLELFHWEPVGHSARVLICLEEIGADYRSRYVDALNFEHFSGDFLKLNPQGLLPVLVADGAALSESSLINEFLAESFPEAKLKPADPAGAYNAQVWSKFVDYNLASSLATGVKRAKPNTLVFTIQGDGDMVNEGLQEVIHAAARGENITCVMLNNGVFGETGGHMTATTVLGQRTKNSLEGRSAAYHGHPILIGDLLAQLDGTAYAARTAVDDAAGVARTKRAFKRAFETQLAGAGFSFVEVLTMCPTGWFVPTAEGPGYLQKVLADVHVTGELKRDGRYVPTAQLRAPA